MCDLHCAAGSRRPAVVTNVPVDSQSHFPPDSASASLQRYVIVSPLAMFLDLVRSHVFPLPELRIGRSAPRGARAEGFTLLHIGMLAPTAAVRNGRETARELLSCPGNAPGHSTTVYRAIRSFHRTHLIRKRSGTSPKKRHKKCASTFRSHKLAATHSCSPWTTAWPI